MYLWVMCENVEGELQEIYDRLASHSGTGEESSGKGLETVTNDVDQ